MEEGFGSDGLQHPAIVSWADIFQKQYNVATFLLLLQQNTAPLRPVVNGMKLVERVWRKWQEVLQETEDNFKVFRNNYDAKLNSDSYFFIV